jgi:hypothetical protein
VIEVQAPAGLGASAEPEQAISEPEQAVRLARMPGASGRNGVVPPPKFRFQPGVSGNPDGRPPKPASAKQLRRLARQLGPRALFCLAQLAEGNEPRVAHLAAVALLDRGYGVPVTADVVEKEVRDERWRKKRAAEELEESAAKEARTKARALLATRWEKLPAEQRRKQLDLLRQTVTEWESQAQWVEAHLDTVSIESLASGETSWTQGEISEVGPDGAASKPRQA